MLFTILGVVCKMASTLLHEIFVEQERDFTQLSCIAAVIISSSFHKQAPLSRIDATHTESRPSVPTMLHANESN